MRFLLLFYFTTSIFRGVTGFTQLPQTRLLTYKKYEPLKCIFPEKPPDDLSSKLPIEQIVKNAYQVTLLPGFYVGVSMNLMSAIFTYHHYQFHIESFQGILLNFLLAVYVYGRDRLYDAYDFEKLILYEPPYNGTDIEKRSPVEWTNVNKIILYKDLLKNQHQYEILFVACFYAIGITLFSQHGNILEGIQCLFLYLISTFIFQQNSLSNDVSLQSEQGDVIRNRFYLQTFHPIVFVFPTLLLIALQQLDTLKYLPFLLLLDSTNSYIELKKTAGLLKPFYVSSLWAIGTTILPCVLYDHNFMILQDVSTIASSFFLIFGFTNLLDLGDIEEDRENHINTIPVVFGERFTRVLSFISLYLSYSFFAMNGFDKVW